MSQVHLKAQGSMTYVFALTAPGCHKSSSPPFPCELSCVLALDCSCRATGKLGGLLREDGGEVLIKNQHANQQSD